MDFRAARLTDIPALSAVRLSVRENALSDPARITREMYVSHLSDIGQGWLCEIDGAVVGFSVADRSDQSIWALFVMPQHERRGIGKALLALAVEWLFANGADSIHLRTAVDTRADEFYRRQGWTRGASVLRGEVSYSLRAP